MSTVVYIGAVGRSGTTLVERTIATSPACTALGEVVHLWDRGVVGDESCGCGQPFSECEFWSEIGQQAFGGWERVDLEQVGSDRRRVDRNRFIPWLLMPAIAPKSFRTARTRLIEVLDRLYEAAGDVADGEVLIDSSKHPSYLFLLSALPSHDVRLLHVVRDPRGVAHSWSKAVARPESGEPMEQLSTIRAISRWTAHNILFQLATVRRVRGKRISYGRFVDEPASVEAAVDELLEQPVTGPLAVHGSTVTLGPDHTVSGNPSRFRVGDVGIRPDHAWRDAMPTRQQRIVGALTTPLRQVYRK